MVVEKRAYLFNAVGIGNGVVVVIGVVAIVVTRADVIRHFRCKEETYLVVDGDCDDLYRRRTTLRMGMGMGIIIGSGGDDWRCCHRITPRCSPGRFLGSQPLTRR